MSSKSRFKVTAECAIGGKKPDECFLLAVADDGVTPVEAYWRKRVADRAIAHDPVDAAPHHADTTKAKAARVAKASTSATSAAADKGNT